MGAYEYTAVDASGKTRKGLLEGDSDRLVRRRLRDDGLVPLSVSEVDRRAVRAARGQPADASRLGKRISGEDVSLFTRLLATLLKSGLPIDEALRAIADQTDRRPLKRAVMAVRSRVNEGHSLGDAMAQLGRQLPDIYVATVQAGEQTKHLPLVLERLADFLEIRAQVRQKVKLALIYPIVLTVVSIAVVVGLLIYVIPEVTQIFDSVDRELPGITQALIATSDFLRANALIVLAMLIAAGFGLRVLWRNERSRKVLDALMLRIPLLRGMVVNSNAGQFTRTLAVLLDGGVELLEALRIGSRAVSNSTIRAGIETAIPKVTEGESLHQSLRGTHALPALTLHLIGSGEASGELVKMLNTAADAHDRQLSTQLGVLLGLLEPALILFMGGTILVIVLAILLPIFELNQLL